MTYSTREVSLEFEVLFPSVSSALPWLDKKMFSWYIVVSIFISYVKFFKQEFNAQ